MEVRCDGVVDCDDKSDEIGCKKVAIASSYSKIISPPALEKGQPKMDIYLTIII